MHAFFIDKLSKGELLGEDTVLGRLARHTDDGKLSFEEMFFIAVLLLLAGNETTTNMLSTLFLTLAGASRSVGLAAAAAGPHRFGHRGAASLRIADPKLLSHSADRLPRRQCDDSREITRVARVGCGQP